MKNFKKKTIFGITLLLSMTMLLPVLEAQFIENIVTQENSLNNNEVTHSVLGEYCSRTTCTYCPKANTQMFELYNKGYEFYYISLVSDKNSIAGSRITELGFFSVPSVAFDGGDITFIGAQKDYIPYKNAVIECSNRTVADIDLDLDVYWMGDDQIQVYVHITNNEVNTYSGHLHVYVTEITSRWNDDDSNPYHFAMIGNYPINKNVNIDAGKTETFFPSKIWKYDNITINNIKVIACVFDSSSKYTDETIAAEPVLPNNDPPSTPDKPTGPSSGNISTTYTFQTSSIEPNEDMIQYGWDWDSDGVVNDWTDFYPSGQTIERSYSWGSTGTYSIKVKAKDQFETESGWSEALEIKMPKNKMYNQMNILFEKFLNSFSIFEKILKQRFS